jgi:RHH-type proline utilization regulon transcriptional repressor/proline dehydrogenase/delta 1-pyrroline-5-carboxylate dehydrogenase
MVAPNFDAAISWQNAVDFGLTAGVHSLDEKECEKWIAQVEAGNLYVNRGTTGAVVNRQPFGGWKRSSVGPTSKAGGANYVNNLREWDPLDSLEKAIETSAHWWVSIGNEAIDHADLQVERNYQRYLPSSRGIVVRVDDSVDSKWIDYITWVAEETKSAIEFSSDHAIEGPVKTIVESEAQLVNRISVKDKVRWLAAGTPPTLEFLAKGISVDRRKIAQRGDVEMPRWVLEQSVSITNHRYGNIGAGPHPHVPHEE